MLTTALVACLTAAAPPHVGLFLAGGPFGSPGGGGGALGAGVRIGLGERFVLGFDVGYGLIAQRPAIQDRWWLMPSAASSFPAGPVQLDLGLGVGFGTASAFTSLTGLSKDQPIWANQMLPAVRGHVRVARALSTGVDLFGRLDFGSQLLTADEGFDATSWSGLFVGVELRLF